ncbi:MAG: YSC84-related protein [Tepidisphaeraceae bacterium]
MTTLALLAGVASIGCQTEPKTEAKREALRDAADASLKQMKAEDPSLDDFLDTAHGYAVFPEVGKGGLIVGGSYGRGIVYQGGEWIGYADISQATVGLQAGGQSFSEVVVFENAGALDRFKTGKLSLTANASAVALKSGAGASAKYSEGVAIFVKPEAGLMAEASVGGQQFTFTPR